MSAELPITNSEPPVATQILSASPARSSRSPVLRQLFQSLLVVVLAIASYYLISHFFLVSVRVVGISMVPTLHDSQRYLLNRWVYHVRAPRRSDIVVLRDPSDNGFSVKRIIAMAGDSIELKEGSVFINGRKLDEPYLVPGTRTFTSPVRREQSFTCASDQYFVLGDNRNSSVDSRSYGPIGRGNILGLIIR